jgi:hypothetical protein
MVPVFQTKQTGDVLLSVARRLNAPIATQATRTTTSCASAGRAMCCPAARLAAGGRRSRTRWREALQVGFVQSTAAPQAAAGGTAAARAQAPQAPRARHRCAGHVAHVMEAATFTGDAGDDAFYLIVYPSYRFFDGRLANRPWLQELPDPVSKFCWSSWVEINPVTADRLRWTTATSSRSRRRAAR